MPISKHYGGSGAKVMRAMRKEYGSEKGEEVFYATENKMKKAKKSKNVKKGGHNPFFGNSLPFQLGTNDRWFKDDRSMGEMSFGKKK